jgi:hypothetical protein
MGFIITYKTLFEVRLLHHYHLDKCGEGNDYVLFDLAGNTVQEEALSKYDIASFLQIEPTETCVALLRKHHCIFRRQGDRLIVAAKVQFDEGLNLYKPFVSLADDLAFTFRYKIADPYFLNYSNIPLQKESNSIYFFQNKSEGSKRIYPGLTKSAPVKDVNELYNAGEILLSADETTVLIANRITGPANAPVQDFTTDPKVNGNALRYVNRNDLIRTSGHLLQIDTGLQDRMEHVTVEITNNSGNVITPRTTLFEDGNTISQIDFTAFAEGLYQIHLEDAGSAYSDDVRFYLQRGKEPFDGVIQIQVKSDEPAFDILNNNGSIKTGNQLRSFELRFKNRATMWRYLGNDLSNEPESGPHLLTRNGFLNLSINDENAVTINDLPNASVSMIKTEKPVAAPEYYNLVSEIYLNS